MEEVLLLNGFDEGHRRYFKRQAPGRLAHWTEVIVDLRWMPEVRIIGRRGNEEDILFVGDVASNDELHKLLVQTRVI